MAAHHAFSLATNIPVYFCDPGSPWQRGSNENTNGPEIAAVLSQSSDLPHSRNDLDAVAAELNSRPRKTLGWGNPAECRARQLSSWRQPVDHCVLRPPGIPHRRGPSVVCLARRQTRPRGRPLQSCWRQVPVPPLRRTEGTGRFASELIDSVFTHRCWTPSRPQLQARPSKILGRPAVFCRRSAASGLSSCLAITQYNRAPHSRVIPGTGKACEP
nr:hypothetical protein [Streptomyces sp. DHE17-7]